MRITALKSSIIGVAVALAALAFVSASPPRGADSEMVLVDGGAYQPLYTAPGAEAAEKVEPFYLDRYPVTNGQYLAFVDANPEWRRSNVRPLFADGGYLKHWTSDLDFGDGSLATSPVVNVSWFAAMAYAKWVGKRLPTAAEWEVAAAAGAKSHDGATEASFRQQILAWYSEPTPDRHPPVGSGAPNYWGAYDLHGLVWEWVADFNSALVTGESRNNTDLDQKLFCGSGSVGASNFEDYAAFIRFAFRSGLEGYFTVQNLGFRLAQDTPSSKRSSTHAN